MQLLEIIQTDRKVFPDCSAGVFAVEISNLIPNSSLKRCVLRPAHCVKKGSCRQLPFFEFGAGDEARTRDLNLGKVALYQLSYSRLVLLFTALALKQVAHFSSSCPVMQITSKGWLQRSDSTYQRRFAGSCMKKGSLLQLPFFEFGAGDEARTRDLNLGKVALYQLSYSRISPRTCSEHLPDSPRYFAAFRVRRCEKKTIANLKFSCQMQTAKNDRNPCIFSRNR